MDPDITTARPPPTEGTHMTGTTRTNARNRPSRLRTLDLGEHRVTFVPDGSAQLIPTVWFPGTTDAVWHEHADHLDEDGCLVATTGGLLVEHGDRALLIDAGFGPHGVEAGGAGPAIGRIDTGALPASLDAAGRDPATVGTVAFTHLHPDHVGWAVAEGTPLAGAELVALGTEGLPGGRVLRDGEELLPGVTTWSTPGHTNGHAAYVIESGGQRLIAFGDIMHSPLQVGQPDWPVVSDEDATAARRSRALLLEELSRPDTLGFGIHFADVVFGRVVTEGADRIWEPLP